VGAIAACQLVLRIPVNDRLWWRTPYVERRATSAAVRGVGVELCACSSFFLGAPVSLANDLFHELLSRIGREQLDCRTP
jgi:hypothetical protein